MSKLHRESTLLSASRPTNAVKGLLTTFDSLVRTGDIETIEKLVGELPKALSLPADVFSPLADRLKHAVEECRSRLGADLRALADAAGCQFDCKLPHLTIGCVSLRENEKKSNQWKLSILDSFILETIQTLSAEEIMRPVMAQIESIEAAVKNFEPFLTSLKGACDALRIPPGSECKVPINVLMLLCAHGPALRKSLISPDGSPANAVSRSQFGFLLRMVVANTSCSGFRVHLVPANIHEATTPHTYIAVPNDIDARKLTAGKPCAFVILTREADK